MRRASTILLVMLAMAAWPSVAAATPAPGPATQSDKAPSDADRQQAVSRAGVMSGPGGPHLHSSYNTNKCLDVYRATGPQIQVYDCHAGGNQKWTFLGYSDGTFDLFTVYNGAYMCLDGFQSQGYQMIWYACDRSSDQRFRRIGSQFEFVLESIDHPGLCVDVMNATGPPVALWPCHYGPNQIWLWP
jgi:hypothetical protein